MDQHVALSRYPPKGVRNFFRLRPAGLTQARWGIPFSLSSSDVRTADARADETLSNPHGASMVRLLQPRPPVPAHGMIAIGAAHQGPLRLVRRYEH